MLDVQSGQHVLEVEHGKLWAIVGKQAFSYFLRVCPVLKECVRNHLRFGELDGDSRCKLGESVSDQEVVLMARLRLQYGPEQI